MADAAAVLQSLVDGISKVIPNEDAGERILGSCLRETREGPGHTVWIVAGAAWGQCGTAGGECDIVSPEKRRSLPRPLRLREHAQSHTRGPMAWVPKTSTSGRR